MHRTGHANITQETSRDPAYVALDRSSIEPSALGQPKRDEIFRLSILHRTRDGAIIARNCGTGRDLP